MGNMSSRRARRTSTRVCTNEPGRAATGDRPEPEIIHTCTIVRNGAGPRASTRLRIREHKSADRTNFAYFRYKGSFREVREISVSVCCENGNITRSFLLSGCQWTQKRFAPTGKHGTAKLQNEFTLAAKWKRTDTSASQAGDTMLRLRCNAQPSQRNHTTIEQLMRNAQWEIVWEYPDAIIRGEQHRCRTYDDTPPSQTLLPRLDRGLTRVTPLPENL